MEQMNMYYGFAIYETSIPSLYNQQTINLSIPGVRDRAIVIVDQVYLIIRISFLMVYVVSNSGG